LPVLQAAGRLRSGKMTARATATTEDRPAISRDGNANDLICRRHAHGTSTGGLAADDHAVDIERRSLREQAEPAHRVHHALKSHRIHPEREGASRPPPPDPPEEHPAASITTATADAMSTFRDFILAPSGICGVAGDPRPAGGEHRDRQRPRNASRNIIEFRTVSHMPDGVHQPNHMPLCHLELTLGDRRGGRPDRPGRS